MEREFEAGLRQTLETSVGGRLAEVACERAKLPTGSGGSGLRPGQAEVAPVATD